MKKKLIYYLLIAAFLLCFASILLGAYFNINALVYAGIGILFGGGFLLAIIVTVVMFVRARKKASEMDRKEENGESAIKNEMSATNRYAAAEDAIAYSIHGFRRLPSKMKALGITFLTVTLGSVFAGLALLFLKRFLAAYICFGIFAACIFAGILVAALSCRAPRLKRERRRDGEYFEAKVLRCDPYSSSYSYAANDNDPVTVRYRVYLKIDGKEYEARTTERCETGETVIATFVDGLAVICRGRAICDGESKHDGSI